MIVGSVLGPFEGVLTDVLIWFHTTVGLPWAWAIVAVTICVRMLLVPLTIKQIHSMQNLQRHAPQMKEIQRKYKGDRAKMNEELMRFYKENRINPAASCLPIVAQIPVFIALFFVLRDFDDEVLPDYPGSDLTWLSVVPDITASANAHWSGYLLLAIYAISQTTATLLMSTTMERTQRLIMLILPLGFLFFILNFPAGLVLYWVTTNLWTTGQGIVTRQLMPKPAAPPKRSSRAAPRAEQEAPPPVEAGDGKPTPQRVRKVKRKKKARR
jgi:YidC/Oxa1 family membrane protein insertase